MKKLVLGGIAAAAICAAVPAFAQAQAPAPAPAPTPQVQTFVHRMPMKTETRNEAVDHARKMFARLDANRDGFVTREEADAAHKAISGEMRDHFAQRLAQHDGMPAADRGAAFDRLDANHDGVIDAAEIKNAAVALKSLDKNADGTLTAAELRRPRPTRAAGAAPSPRPTQKRSRSTAPEVEPRN